MLNDLPASKIISIYCMGISLEAKDSCLLSRLKQNYDNKHEGLIYKLLDIEIFKYLLN